MALETFQMNDVVNFPDMDERLAIIHRDIPDSGAFFDTLLTRDVEIFGVVGCDSAEKDIQLLCKPSLPSHVIDHAFYSDWVIDMANMCRLFGELLKSDRVSLWLGTDRGCRRYHTDNVPMRLVVTYAGRGTEWLPEEAVNRTAYMAGEPNEAILTNPNARQWLEPWGVGIFKGGKNGVLHRTPDDALNQRTMLLRIDHADYWSGMNQHGLDVDENYATTPAV